MDHQGHPGPSPAFEDDLERTQRHFNAAMDRYEHQSIYRWIGTATSLIILAGQGYFLVATLRGPLGLPGHLVALVAAFVLADFVNGVVHMIMDNTAGYDSALGPLIAAFHLHHRTLVYRPAPVVRVYAAESGSKIWLACAYGIVAAIQVFIPVPPFPLALFAYFGVFSCVAEVSHYLCHVPRGRIAIRLSQCGLLLSPKHHMNHHAADNTHYAFLNGMTNPLLNRIARRFFPGYKNTTDLHHAAYSGKGTANRGG